MKEGKDYELVPVEDEKGNQQAWHVRILEGDFVETIVSLGNIAFDGENDCLKFNFMIQSSPDPDLTEENLDLQENMADILEDILEVAIEDGSVVYGDPEQSED